MDEFANMSEAEIQVLISNVNGEMVKNRKQITSLAREIESYNQQVAAIEDRIKKSITLPHMVASIGEIIDMEDEEDEEDLRQGSGITNQKKSKDKNDQEERKAVVLKTTSRQTVYLPGFGMIDPTGLRPGDLVGIQKESFNIFQRLPQDYDSRVKAMEVDERPTEEYSDIGGLDKQIEELVEAIVLPMQQKDRFKK